MDSTLLTIDAYGYVNESFGTSKWFPYQTVTNFIKCADI